MTKASLGERISIEHSVDARHAFPIPLGGTKKVWRAVEKGMKIKK